MSNFQAAWSGGECGAPACRKFKSLVSVPKPLFLMIARSPLMFQLSMRIGVLRYQRAHAELLPAWELCTQAARAFQSKNPDKGNRPSRITKL